MRLHTIINGFIKKIKKEPFSLDENIPFHYLLSLFFNKAISLFWGVLKFKRFGNYFIHHTAKVKCTKKIKCLGTLSIDQNCFIDALSSDGIVFGNNVSIGKNTSIECSGTLKLIGKGLVVGNNVGLGTHGFFGCAGGIEIGDNTIFGNYVSLHSENHNFQDTKTPIRLQGITRKGIRIGNDCWIGSKVTILDGTKIGDGCVIAAGAVTRGVIPPYSIIAGVPGKIIKSR